MIAVIVASVEAVTDDQNIRLLVGEKESERERERETEGEKKKREREITREKISQ